MKKIIAISITILLLGVVYGGIVIYGTPNSLSSSENEYEWSISFGYERHGGGSGRGVKSGETITHDFEITNPNVDLVIIRIYDSDGENSPIDSIPDIHEGQWSFEGELLGNPMEGIEGQDSEVYFTLIMHPGRMDWLDDKGRVKWIGTDAEFEDVWNTTHDCMWYDFITNDAQQNPNPFPEQSCLGTYSVEMSVEIKNNNAVTAIEDTNDMAVAEVQQYEILSITVLDKTQVV